jgi:hypothetical protein
VVVIGGTRLGCRDLKIFFLYKVAVVYHDIGETETSFANMRDDESVEGFLTEVNMEIRRRDDIQVQVHVNCKVHNDDCTPPPFSSAFHLRLIAV